MAKQTPVVKYLRKARGLIAKGWAQRTFARDRSGEGVHLYSNEASCFCVIGALAKTGCPSSIQYEATVLLSDVVGLPGNNGCPLIEWNDAPGRTQEQVLAAFDAAIKSALKADGAPQ